MGVRKLYQRAVLRESRLMLSEAPALRPDTRKSCLREQISSPLTTEDRFWGRLSDNWTPKDVLTATHLENLNQVYEAYSAKVDPYTARAKNPKMKVKSFDCSIMLNVVFVKVKLSATWER